MARAPQLAAVAVALVLVLSAAGYGITRGLVSDGSGTPGDSDSFKVSVVVAAHDIAAGTRIEANMLYVSRVFPKKAASGTYGDASNLIGQVAALDIPAGEPVTGVKLASPEDATRTRCLVGTCGEPGP